MTIFRSFKNIYLKPENVRKPENETEQIKMSIHQIEWMVAGLCQTWIDHARPRSDLHPHIFATKARWRGIAQPLCPATATAHLPNVLAVGSQSHSHWSDNPAIGSWTSRIIVRWRSFFWKMDEHGWLPSSILPSSKFLPTRKLRSAGHLRHIASLKPKGTSGNSQSKRVTRRVRLQNSNPNPHTLPSNWNRKSPSKHHSKWLLWSLASPLCVTTWARQLQPQLQCFKWHKTSRVWNIAITPPWSTEPTVASTVAVQLQLQPLKKGIKKLQTRNFHEISWDF